MPHYKIIASRIAAVAALCLFSFSAVAETCASGSYLYKMILKGGETSDLLPAVLRRYSPETRVIIGGPILYGPFGSVGDGGWLVTFEFEGRLFTLVPESNPSSTWRNDETIFFMDGYSTVAVFDLLAMSKAGEYLVEHDFFGEETAPPDQLHLTISTYKFLKSYVYDASFFIDSTGDKARAERDFHDRFSLMLNSSSGAWTLVGCYDE